jgi:hypothetical protein
MIFGTGSRNDENYLFYIPPFFFRLSQQYSSFASFARLFAGIEILRMWMQDFFAFSNALERVGVRLDLRNYIQASRAQLRCASFATFVTFATFATFASVLAGIGCLRTWMRIGLAPLHCASGIIRPALSTHEENKLELELWFLTAIHHTICQVSKLSGE